MSPTKEGRWDIFNICLPNKRKAKNCLVAVMFFSLGAVLYEMVTGKQALEGKSQLSVASAILDKEPDSISTIKLLTRSTLDHARQARPTGLFQTQARQLSASEARCLLSEGGGLTVDSPHPTLT